MDKPLLAFRAGDAEVAPTILMSYRTFMDFRAAGLLEQHGIDTFTFDGVLIERANMHESWRIE